MSGGTTEDPLSSFDFSTIDDMDPSLSGGHRVIYEREVPFELRVQQSNDAPQEAGTLEAVKVKLLLLGDDAAPAAFRVELTSENDVSTHRPFPDSENWPYGEFPHLHARRSYNSHQGL